MSTTVEAPAVPRLKERYLKEIVPELEKEFNYSNRAETEGNACKEVCRTVPSARRPGYRRIRDFARRPYVGIP